MLVPHSRFVRDIVVSAASDAARRFLLDLKQSLVESLFSRPMETGRGVFIYCAAMLFRSQNVRSSLWSITGGDGVKWKSQ